MYGFIQIIFNKIFKTIVITIIVTIVIILLMYKDEKPPAADSLNVDMDQYINFVVESQIQKLTTGTTDSISIGIPEELINREIHNLLEQNDSKEGYIYENIHYRIQDVWVELDDNYINVIISVHLDTKVMTYKTSLKLRFEVKDAQPGTIILKLRSMKLGNIPIRWTVVLATEIFDIGDLINQALTDIGEFDKTNLELKIDLTKFLNKNSDMFISLLQFAKENDLLQMGVIPNGDEYILGGRINFEKLRFDDLPVTLTDDQKIHNQDELEVMVKNHVLTNLFSNGYQIDFSEQDVQKIIDFTLMRKIETTDDYIFKGELFENYELYILQPYTTVTDKLMLNIPIKIGSGHNYFTTCIQFELSLTPRGNDLILAVENTYIQNKPVNKELVQMLLDKFDSDLTTLVNESIVLENFFQPFVEDGVMIQEIDIKEGKMIFVFNGFNINEMLTEIIDNVDIPEINDIIQDMLNNIDNEEKLVEMSDELVTKYNNLSVTDQKLIMDIVKENVDKIPDFVAGGVNDFGNK